MATETERKFLVKGNGWKKLVTKKVKIRQGYLAKSRDRTVRIRIAGDQAFITVKGKRVNLSCSEFEYPIPVDDAEQLIAMSVTPLIEKTRHYVTYSWWKFEVDVFEGVNEGLVMAEFEQTPHQDPTKIDALMLPKWLGAEVSYDKRYTNVYIAEHAVPHSL